MLALGIAGSFAVKREFNHKVVFLSFHDKNAIVSILIMVNMLIRAHFHWLPSRVAVLVSNLDTFISDR